MTTIKRLAIILPVCALFAAGIHAKSALALAQVEAVQSAQAASAGYACPMHPEVTSNSPGSCPKCEMRLTKHTGGARTASARPSTETERHLSIRVPDTPVVDQFGRQLHFYSDLVKGKTVAINFIFTTCTTICPPLAATFRKVQMELGGRIGKDIALISVSVDPTTDVPERLKTFSEKFHAGPGWTFVTGSKPEIDLLLRALGAEVADKTAHSPMILAGNDATGEWTRTYGLAPAASIVKVVLESASEAPANYFTNLELVTQDNQPVRFYNDLLKDKIVLINFMFATCTSVCPPMTANLAKVQRFLGDRVGKDVVMISITVDPENDTPAVLKKYAGQFKAGPGWYFLTGKKENVDWVLYKLGGYVEEKTDHSGVLLIGNVAKGEWVKALALSRPEEIANAVTKMLH